jgi:hypothetical protein
MPAPGFSAPIFLVEAREKFCKVEIILPMLSTVGLTGVAWASAPDD